MTSPPAFTASPQVVVHGGGIAGLWILRELLARGLDAVLIEKQALGSAQTIASQGVIHGGVKYALNGVLTDSSEAIRDMPARWAAAMHGDGAVPLPDVRLLSDHQVLWSSSTLAGRLTTFFASRALSSRLSRMEDSTLPEAFRNPRFHGSVYRIEEQVLDVHSILSSLAQPVLDRILLATQTRLVSEGDRVLRAELETPQGAVLLTDSIHVFSAGVGNEDLLHGCGLPSLPKTQRRPLHQVMIRKPDLPPLFGVCMGGAAKPLLVVTTHYDRAGVPLWYLGGELAESGVTRTRHDQVIAARNRLSQLFPWMDWSNAQWSTWFGDRAEPARDDGTRPPGALATRVGNVIPAWPSKLALAPSLADQVVSLLPELSASTASTLFPHFLPRPPIARPPWEIESFER